MWRRAILFVLLLGGLLIGSAAAQEKSYGAERFDVDVVVEEDGTLLVTETVTFNFVGGPFTFVFRELETALSDGITDIRASVDGRAFPPGDQPGQVEISGSNPVRVEWHLEPTSNSTRTFTLTYRQLGVVRQTDTADLLRYQPLPDDHDYVIGSSTVTFSYPQTAELAGPPSVTTQNAAVRQQDRQVIVTAQNLEEDETLVVEMPFAAGSLLTAPPAWQQRQAAQRATAPLWLGAGAAILAVGLVILVLVYRRNRPQAAAPTRTVYEPPSDLPPALAGAITGVSADPSWQHALGTLFDLGRRAVLRIEELPKEKWYRRQDFVVERVQEPAGLLPHERGLLALLFETKRGATSTVKLSDLGSRVTSRQWDKFADPLKEELRMAGFISEKRKAARVRMIAGGILLMLLAVATGVAIALLGNPWAMATAGGGLVLGLITAVAGATLSPLSDEGATKAAAWQGFADHLKDVAKGRSAVSGPEMFERFLPYAASFGLLEAWAKWFEKQGWTELPPYFHPLSTADRSPAAAFVMLAVISSSSGGSASGAAGAAGAGAAGGGASGAG